MNIYEWESNTLAGCYTEGTIIVVAESVEEAREKVLSHPAIKSLSLNRIKYDLSYPPSESPIENTVIFIRGGD